MTLAATRHRQKGLAVRRRASAKFDPRAVALAPRRRYGPLDKLEICEAVHAGLVTVGEIQEAHRLSDDEVRMWLAAYRKLRAGQAPTMTDALRGRE